MYINNIHVCENLHDNFNIEIAFNATKHQLRMSKKNALSSEKAQLESHNHTCTHNICTLYVLQDMYMYIPVLELLLGGSSELLRIPSSVE